MLRAAALAGPEPGVLSLGRCVEELHVGAACQAAWAGWTAVDFGGEDCVDEGVDSGVPVYEGLPPGCGVEGLARWREAGDSLRWVWGLKHGGMIDDCRL